MRIQAKCMLSCFKSALRTCCAGIDDLRPHEVDGLRYLQFLPTCEREKERGGKTSPRSQLCFYVEKVVSRWRRRHANFSWVKFSPPVVRNALSCRCCCRCSYFCRRTAGAVLQLNTHSGQLRKVNLDQRYVSLRQVR